MDLRTQGGGRVSWDEVRECSVLCAHLEGWDREGGQETQEGGGMGMYVFIQLIHFVIQ